MQSTFFSPGRHTIISGPCSAETEEQLLSTAILLAKNKKINVLRAGIWKPRTKPGQFEGAARRAHELGFQLENFWLKEPGMSPARLTQILKTRGVRGLIVGPLENLRETPELPWSDFALVALGYSLHTPAVSRVSHAHFGAMNRAMEELIARGYRRIGYVTTADIYAAAIVAMSAAGFLARRAMAARRVLPG